MKKLYLFTQIYPYNKGEAFVENEINFLSQYFDKVVIISTNKGELSREVPNNAELITFQQPSSSDKKRVLLKNFFLVVKLIVIEGLFSRQKKLFIRKLSNSIHFLLNALWHADNISTLIDREEASDSYFYSYWFYDWNLSLALLKSKKHIRLNYTRAHGFDLYENNGKPNYLPYRKFCLDNTDRVFTVSKVGSDYLKNIYPNHHFKISCEYLGTKDFGVNVAPVDSEPIHVVSCSNIVPIKRLDKIVEILKASNLDIIWTHIGDGYLKESIQKLSDDLPKNIKVYFKGQLGQREIFEFYRNTPIDLFLNCSLSEGLPVSIMEAISFGIPVMATDVGGTKEIVNSSTGYLMPEEINISEAANFLNKVRTNNSLNRLEIKRFWNSNFYADSNYLNFYNNYFK